jgi:Fur family transcriptional regulator, ferric uptake regulator
VKEEKDFEKANFRALLESITLDRVQERLEILDVFLDTEDHVTVDELLSLLNAKGFRLERDFVRRSMDGMVDLGFAQREAFKDQPIRYEHRHIGRHHDHLICTKCGKIMEFASDEMEGLQEAIASRAGFLMLQHKMEIYGLCAQCLGKRRSLLPLLLAKTGERVVIKEMTGGSIARARLAAMGLRPGDEIEIIKNDGQGRLILAHGNTRLALGKGVASKILVSLPLDPRS